MANAIQRLAARALGLHTTDDVKALAESWASDSISAGEPGWTLISGAGLGAPQPDLIRKIQQEALVASIKDPLLKQAVRLKKYFILGPGPTFTAESPEANRVLQDHWNDKVEKMPEQLEDWLQSVLITNELCLRFYEEIDGACRVRMIPLSEITDVITDADDRNVIRYVRHQYTRDEFDEASKQHRYTPVDELIPGEEVYWLAIDRPPGWTRSISPLYAAMPWAKAYADWLQDRVRINKAKGAWAWLRKVIGGAATVADGAAKLASNVAGALRGSGKGGDDNKMPPPKAGSVINANQGVEWSVINAKVGADDAKEDGRALKLQVASATNVFEHYFGDPSTGNLATAQAMELPMLTEYEVMRAILGRVLYYVFYRILMAKLKAKRLELPETYEVIRQIVKDGALTDDVVEKKTIATPIDINWPPLKTEKRTDVVTAAQKEQQMGIKSDETIASELGVEDWPLEQARLHKEAEAKAAKRREEMTQQYPPFPDPGAQGGDGGNGNAGGAGA